MTLRTTQTKNEMLSKKDKWGMGGPLNFLILHKYKFLSKVKGLSNLSNTIHGDRQY